MNPATKPYPNYPKTITSKPITSVIPYIFH